MVLDVKGSKSEKKYDVSVASGHYVRIEVSDDRTVTLLNPLNGNTVKPSDRNEVAGGSKSIEFLRKNHSFNVPFADYIQFMSGTTIAHTEANYIFSRREFRASDMISNRTLANLLHGPHQHKSGQKGRPKHVEDVHEGDVWDDKELYEEPVTSLLLKADETRTVPEGMSCGPKVVRLNITSGCHTGVMVDFPK